jgi:exopolysaccharide biosynthesis protein
LTNQVPPLKPGDTVQLSTESIPDLSGVEVAIGGGPTLVQDSQIMSWKGWVHLPQPRTALGWNKKYIYLVEVDGRQLDLSLGMTFTQLAKYLHDLGCEQAMNLDGGGSATLWAFGEVKNSPSEGQERPAPNSLVLVTSTPVAAAK